MAAGPDGLEARIGYRFKNRQYLTEALTHRSYSHESEGSGPHNERLEFLGDAVLGMIVSEYLVDQYPGDAEGRLSKAKSQWVSSQHLVEVSRRLNLGQHLRVGRCEEMSGGRDKRALLANCTEALIAAIYLDGGLEPVREFICNHVIPTCLEGDLDEDFSQEDFKGALQEKAQKLRLPHPRYSTVEERGPEHDKQFVLEVRVGPDWRGRGEGSSKKKAGQAAARQVFEQMENHNGAELAIGAELL